MKKHYNIFLSLLSTVLLSAPQITFAATSCKTGDPDFSNFVCAVGTLTAYINLLIPLIIGLAVFLFIFGLLKYVTAGADSKKVVEARNFIIFAVIGISVMISVWGLVNLVVGTFFSSSGSGGTILIPQIKVK